MIHFRLVGEALNGKAKYPEMGIPKIPNTHTLGIFGVSIFGYVSSLGSKTTSKSKKYGENRKWKRERERRTDDICYISAVGKSSSWPFRKINAVRWEIGFGCGFEVIIVAIVDQRVPEDIETRYL